MNKNNIFYVKMNVEHRMIGVFNIYNKLLIERKDSVNRVYQFLKNTQLFKPIYFIYISSSKQVSIVSVFVKDNVVYVIAPTTMDWAYNETILDIISAYFTASSGKKFGVLSILNIEKFETTTKDVYDYFKKMIWITEFTYKNGHKFLTIQKALNEATRLDRRSRVSIKTLDAFLNLIKKK